MTDKKNALQNDAVLSRPFFSIIIPVYNAASYLKECLEGILAQDFESWEAIIVDDGSTDSSTDIIEGFMKTDPRIRLFRSERNSGGAFLPRLRAATLSTGKYIVTIDADDTVDADLLSSLHQAAISCNIDLAIPEMWRFGKGAPYKYLPLDSIDVRSVLKGSDLVGKTLVRWSIPMCGFAVRREIYLDAYSRVNPEEGSSIFADELLSRWLLFLSKDVKICGSRYHYRYNSESVTNVNLPRIISSRLMTADSLIAMADSTFGKGSSTYLLALENKLYKAVDLLRMVNSSSLTLSQKRSCTRLVSSAMKGFDLSPLKGHTSPRYLSLMRLPMPLARIALLIIDHIIKKNNG